jgi:hypothetical protein
VILIDIKASQRSTVDVDILVQGGDSNSDTLAGCQHLPQRCICDAAGSCHLRILRPPPSQPSRAHQEEAEMPSYQAATPTSSGGCRFGFFPWGWKSQCRGPPSTERPCRLRPGVSQRSPCHTAGPKGTCHVQVQTRHYRAGWRRPHGRAAERHRPPHPAPASPPPTSPGPSSATPSTLTCGHALY